MAAPPAAATPPGLPAELFRPLVRGTDAYVTTAALEALSAAAGAAGWRRESETLRMWGEVAHTMHELLERHSGRANRKAALLRGGAPEGGLMPPHGCCHAVFCAVEAGLRAEQTPSRRVWLHGAYTFLTSDADTLLSVRAHQALERCCGVVRAMIPQAAALEHSGSEEGSCAYTLLLSPQ